MICRTVPRKPQTEKRDVDPEDVKKTINSTNCMSTACLILIETQVLFCWVVGVGFDASLVPQKSIENVGAWGPLN